MRSLDHRLNHEAVDPRLRRQRPGLGLDRPHCVGLLGRGGAVALVVYRDPAQAGTRQLVVTVPAHDTELASDLLWSLGVLAVEERDGPDGAVELWTSLGDESDPDWAARTEHLTSVSWPYRFVEVDPGVADTWRQFATPIRVSPTLTVRPSWVPYDASAGERVVHIDPGATFGMGDHPTTRLSLAAVERLVRPSHRVLDVGCGSGVLAIAAALFGAAYSVGVDIAPAAVPVTVANAQLNGVTVEVSNMPLSDVPGTFDVVFANILAPVLISLSEELKRVVTRSGRLVISGVLANNHQHVLDALAPLRAVRVDELDGWVAVELTW